MTKVVSLYASRSPMYENLNQRASAYAAHLGLEYLWAPHDSYSDEYAVEQLKDADAGIIDVDPFDKKIFSQLGSNCRLLVRYGVGFDAVNLEDATEAGIAVARTAGANAESVAEMALSLIMAAKRQLVLNQRIVDAGLWEHHIGAELFGKKVGILGFGAIGKCLAQLLGGFDADIYAYDPHIDADGIAQYGARKADLETIFSTCDAISVHVPYFPATYHLIDAHLLSLMKSDAVIVCTSRGNVVDEDALSDVLRAHKILGAGLDVFAQEPLPADSPLRGLDNIILTPHVSAQTTDALWNIYKRALEITADFFAGKELSRADLLNPDYKLHARR